MVVLDVTIVNIALPSAQRDLGFSADDRQWVITAYALAFGSLLLLGGRIADLFGRKWTFIAGLLGFAGASAVGGAAHELRACSSAPARVQGVFGALLAPAALSLLTTTFTDPKERGKAFAIYAAIAGMGGAIGLLLGGALTELLDWRWCLYVSVVFALPGGDAARGCCATCRSRTGRGSTSAARWPPRPACSRWCSACRGRRPTAGATRSRSAASPRSAVLLTGLHRPAAPDEAAAAAAAGRLRPRPRRVLPGDRHRQRGSLRPLPVPDVLPAADQGLQRVRDRARVPADEPLDRAHGRRSITTKILPRTGPRPLVPAGMLLGARRACCC